MAVTAGAVSKVSSSQTTATVQSTAASGGTGPYTYQWYKSTVSGFTPGAGNLISGATALTLNDTGLTPGIPYYYEIVATDTGAGNAQAASAQLAVYTSAPLPQQNQFQQGPYLGTADLKMSRGTVSMQVDTSQATPLANGQAVKVVGKKGGIPKVVACAANSDQVIGFISYDIKSQAYNAGDKCEVNMMGNYVYLQATGPIAQFAQVTLDVSAIGGVAQKVTSSGAAIVGYAFDQANGGDLIRVHVATPAYTFA